MVMVTHSGRKNAMVNLSPPLTHPKKIYGWFPQRYFFQS
ncbi:protein of unknown function [Limnospira indica PCC 8005]|uniref:Uncharacterized protein n=1 Tax=Limnospira indica PCC 8005 TaxID=376219 RepID=A0A9P1P2K7_9CYAN|nr:protein of unknown function [Limnospira indica PCC 8005]